MGKKPTGNRGRAFEGALERLHAGWRPVVLPTGQIVGGRGVVVVKVPNEIAVRRGADGEIIGAGIRAAKRVVDFLGALEDGVAVAIEAKEHRGHRFPLSAVTESQTEFMRQWPSTAIGLILVHMVHERVGCSACSGPGSARTAWAVPFVQFLRALDSGVRAWPLPGHESNLAKLKGEDNLGSVGVQLPLNLDWHTVLRRGQLDAKLCLGVE